MRGCVVHSARYLHVHRSQHHHRHTAGPPGPARNRQRTLRVTYIHDTDTRAHTRAPRAPSPFFSARSAALEPTGGSLATRWRRKRWQACTHAPYASIPPAVVPISSSHRHLRGAQRPRSDTVGLSSFRIFCRKQSHDNGLRGQSAYLHVALIMAVPMTAFIAR